MNPQTVDSNYKKALWTLPYTIVLVGLFFSFASLSEFYNVAIQGQTNTYPWGPINDNPWYYRSPTIYSAYNLASGALFLAASLLTIWAAIRRSKKFVIVGTVLTTLFFLIDLIIARIQ